MELLHAIRATAAGGTDSGVVANLTLHLNSVALTRAAHSQRARGGGVGQVTPGPGDQRAGDIHPVRSDGHPEDIAWP